MLETSSRKTPQHAFEETRQPASGGIGPDRDCTSTLDPWSELKRLSQGTQQIGLEETDQPAFDEAGAEASHTDRPNIHSELGTEFHILSEPFMSKTQEEAGPVHTLELQSFGSVDSGLYLFGAAQIFFF